MGEKPRRNSSWATAFMRQSGIRAGSGVPGLCRDPAGSGDQPLCSAPKSGLMAVSTPLQRGNLQLESPPNYPCASGCSLPTCPLPSSPHLALIPLLLPSLSMTSFSSSRKNTGSTLLGDCLALHFHPRLAYLPSRAGAQWVLRRSRCCLTHP